MCGIFGVIYGPDGPEAEEWTPAEMASFMFPAIVHRGPHAYGWMYSDGETITTHVAKGRADTKRCIRSIDIPDNVEWFVGHVRWATHGDPSNPLNNHPICHKDIVGVHNGVISNYDEILKQTGRDDDAREVDSEAIFAAVSKWGHGKGLAKLRGQMVAVYADRKFPHTLRIARTSGRPLVMAKTPTGAIIFASECCVIDATSAEHGDFSEVKTYRMLLLRQGKIVQRSDIARPHFDRDAFATWHRPHYSESNMPNHHVGLHSPRVMKALETMNKGPLRSALAPMVPTEVTQHPPVRRTPSQNVKPQVDGTHDAVTGLYWYNGVLVDLDTYIDAIVEEGHTT